MLNFPYTKDGFNLATSWINKQAGRLRTSRNRDIQLCLIAYRNLYDDLMSKNIDIHRMAMINVIDIANKARKDYLKNHVVAS